MQRWLERELGGFDEFGLTDRLQSKSLCFFITPAIAAGLTAVGVGAAAAGTIAAVAGPVIVGAGVGALGAAVTGGDPGKGALFGGITGGIAGGFGALTGGFGGAGGAAVDAAGDALAPAASSLVDGAGGATSAFASDVGNATLSGAAGALPAGASEADLAAAGLSGGATGESVTPLSAANVASSPSSGFSFSNLFNGNSAAQGALKSAAQTALGGNSNKNNGSSGIGATALALGALAGLGSAMSKPKSGANLPGPSSTAATAGPYFNMGLQPSGTYLNRTPINPLPTAGSSQTMGGGPEQLYFQNNQLHFAGGGALTSNDNAPAFDSDRGDHYVEGEADGQSDLTNAKLSAGEYVLDAATVSRLGSGNNAAGAKVLDRFRREIAEGAGSRAVVPPKAKSPDHYLKRARGGR